MRRFSRTLALTFAGISMLASTCGVPAPTTLRGGGIVARLVTGNERATRVEGVVAAPGDYVLEGEGIRVVIGGLAREGRARGAILEAGREGAPVEDGIAWLSPTLLVNDRPHAIVPYAISLVQRRGRPAVRVDGTARTSSQVLDVATEIAVGRGGRQLYVISRAVPRTSSLHDRLRLGTSVAWGGAQPFVPGTGPITDGWSESSWVGVEGTVTSMALGIEGAPVRTRPVYERHGDTRFLEYTDVVGRAEALAGAVIARTVLGLADGGLADAVRRLGWASGRPYREVALFLPYAPEGATVQITTTSGRPLITARPDAHGSVVVPLAPLVGVPTDDLGLRASASAYGHAPSDDVSFEPDQTAPLVLTIPRGGRIRIRARDANDAPLLARARIVGVSGTLAPSLGPDHSAKGAGDAILLENGEADVAVEPGRYRVFVTRGPEWTRHDETVLVTETFRPDVRARLEHVVDPGRWIGCDFHVHAAPSPDSQVTLEDRIRSLVAEGIAFAVPTDHNHVTDYGPAIESLGVSGFASIPGVEVTTAEPAFGHFNAFPLRVDHALVGNGAPPFLGITPQALFDVLHARGPDVLVQVNHPRLEGGIGFFDAADLDPTTGTARLPYSASFDTLEVWNGFDLARSASFERVFQDWLAFLTRGEHVVATGNSDSHTVRYQWAGYPRTYVFVNERQDGALGLEVTRALADGHAFVTSGPFVEASIGPAMPGDTARVRDGVARVRVVVRAPPWMTVSSVDVYAAGAVVASAAIEAPASARGASRPGSRRAQAVAVPVTRFDRELEFAVESDTYAVVLVRGNTPLDDYFGRNEIPPLAFTNPIWIDVDGDGRVGQTRRSHVVPAPDSAALLPSVGGDGAPDGVLDASVSRAPRPASQAHRGDDAGP